MKDLIARPGRVKMIAECEDSTEAVQTIDCEIKSFTALERERFGITPEWIDEHVSAMEGEAREATSAS